MIIGDIETTEKVEYEDLLKNYYEKMEIIEEQDKEIERLHSIIKEVREYIENHSITNMEWWITGQQKVECKFMEDANPQELLELLDKGSDKE